MEKLIITAAITGAITLPTQTPYLPITPEQIADEAVRAGEAGAAMVHIHARDPKDGRPTTDLDVYRDILTRIKQRSDVVICLTTGARPDISIEERTRAIPIFKPEIAPIDMGTITLSAHPLLKRIKDEEYKYPWEKEYIEMTKDAVFKNSFSDLEILAQVLKENDTKPEAGVFDIGHLYNIHYLVREGFIQLPLQMNFVTGTLGGIRGTVEDVVYMKNTADRLFGANNYQWGVIGAGYPQEFNVATLAIVMGGHVRVGVEDNIFLKKGILAKSNAELVEKVVRIARELEREIATPDEARSILKLKGKNKVNF